jgi:hypothetical protein
MGIINGTITTGGTAQDITTTAVGPFEFRNESAGDLRITWDSTTPAASSGWLIKTGESYYRDRQCGARLRVWGATTAQAFAVELI